MMGAREDERAALALWRAGWTCAYIRRRAGLSERGLRRLLAREGLLAARPHADPETREGRRRERLRRGANLREGDGMEAARDEARARIAARMAEEARRGAKVAPGAAQAVCGASARVVAAGTLAEERAPRPGGADFARCARRLVGAGSDTETFVDRAVRRVEARRTVCAAAAWHPTPVPGEGRAPTTAG
jgi:hypothetical protein